MVVKGSACLRSLFVQSRLALHYEAAASDDGEG